MLDRLDWAGHCRAPRYDVKFKMIDGSVCNVLFGTNAAQLCFICGATPKEMNLNTIINKTPNQDMYQFGLSPLHLWIRCFENLLHIAYRLPFKKWQVRGDHNKQIFADNKKIIQGKFKQEMGLLIDIPKVAYGSSNDGNTARRFFRNPTVNSSITNIDYQLIFNLGTILRVISCGHKINFTEFQKIIEKTKSLYLSLYSWYYMSVTMDKLLVHATDIIVNSIVPIGKLSEEPFGSTSKTY